MARIPTYSFKDFKPAIPNHSFFNSEKTAATGQSVSSNSIYSFFPFVHDSNCLTTKFTGSSVSTETLSFNQERRPFFDDQYNWIRNDFDPSCLSLCKYYGSGTLAANEVSAFNFDQQSGGAVPWSYPFGVSGGLDIIRYAVSQLYSWYEPYESELYGNKEIEWNNGKLYLSKNINGGIDWWIHKLDPNDRDKDAILLIQDGYTWGRQCFEDYTIYEGLRQYLDLAAQGPPFYLAPSDIVFNPPLPQTYHNPIAPNGWFGYKGSYGVASASEYFSDHFFSMPNMHGFPMYTKDYEDENGRYHIYQSLWPAEFVGYVVGGDALSSSPFFSNYWNNAVGTTLTNGGFRETIVNGAERGTSPTTIVLNKGNYVFQNATLDYGGENIHRIASVVYNNTPWTQKQYYNYDCSVLEVPIVPSAILPYLAGNQGFFNFGHQIPYWFDVRWNELHFYCPTTDKLISITDNYAPSAYILGTDRTTQSFSANQKFYGLSGIDDFELIAIMGHPLGSPLNYLEMTMTIPSGVDGFTKVKFYKKVYGDNSQFLDSNKVCFIYERKNYGDLKDAAVGIYGVMSLDNESASSIGRAPNIFGGSVDNRITSSFTGFCDAWRHRFTDEFCTSADNFAQVRHEGAAVFRTTCGGYEIPKGWHVNQIFIIIGNNKEEVMEKVKTFVEQYDPPMFVKPEDVMPEKMFNYTLPFKAGNIF